MNFIYHQRNKGLQNLKCQPEYIRLQHCDEISFHEPDEKAESPILWLKEYK